MKELELSKKMIKNFVDCLNLDGDYYYSVMADVPVYFSDMEECGKYLTPGSLELEEYIQAEKFSLEEKKCISELGLILLNSNFYINSADYMDYFITLIHENIHANRTILLNKQDTDRLNLPTILYANKHFSQMSKSSTPYYADASQEILKGSIDDSNKTIDSYKNLSKKEKVILALANQRYYDKMKEQYKIDEALVELMSIISYLLSIKETNNVMEIVKFINKRAEAEDIKAITNIIIRHNDLDLFKWMIDPLSYQIDDVNYDYFREYITIDDEQDYINIINHRDDIEDEKLTRR